MYKNFNFEKYLAYNHKAPSSWICDYTKLMGVNGCNAPRLVGQVHEKQRCSDLCFQQTPRLE